MSQKKRLVMAGRIAARAGVPDARRPSAREPASASSAHSAAKAQAAVEAPKDRAEKAPSAAKEKILRALEKLHPME